MKKNYSLNKGNTLEKLGKNNKWFILSISFVVLLFILVSIVVIKSDNQHHIIKQLYAKAYVAYASIDLTKPYSNELDPKIEESISLLNAVVEKKSSYEENYYALYNIGNLYAFMENNDKALPYLIKVQDAPTSFIAKPKALTLLARIYTQKEEWDKAISIYTEVTKKYNDVIKDFAFYELGLLYTKKALLNNAINAYKGIPANSSLYALSQRNIFIINTILQKS